MDLKLPFKITKQFDNAEDAFAFFREAEATYNAISVRIIYGPYGDVYVEVDLEER